METFIVHILKSSACIALFYILYVLIFRGDSGFKFVRYYFLVSVTLSMLLPFNQFSIRLDPHFLVVENTVQPGNQASETGLSGNIQNENQHMPLQNTGFESEKQTAGYIPILEWMYILGLIVVSTMFILGLLKVLSCYARSTKEKRGRMILLTNYQIAGSFSFLNLIFVNPQGLGENELESVIAHENIHVAQNHTIDLILIELLSAVMWFNPFVWMLRSSIRQVHEYLADEGVLEIGFDRLEYQTLLINQVAESRLLSLASSFNHSQIKNRIIMMTKLKSSNRTKLKLFILMPVTAVLFFTFSCINGQNKPANVVTAVEPVRMNVLYIGVDNPVKIAASGYETSDLEVSVDNGTISGKNGEYIIRPRERGSATVTVKYQGKVIQNTRFRVKYVPDPIAAVQLTDGKTTRLKKGGNISKKELLASGGIVADIENFDFDLNFKVVSFVLSATVPNSYTVREEISNSDRFSKSQLDLINSLLGNQKLTVENITATGPDGTKRTLNSLVFTISPD